MGAAKRRRDAFFAAHPVCCFCGGREPAVTVDHVPPRSAFVSRIGPENFEFPACVPCNKGSAASEQAFALYARLFDQNDANYDQSHTRRLISGVKNNLPSALPRTDISAGEKRRVLRHFGWERSRGAFLEDIGLVGLPEEAGGHIERVAAKLLAALHYRHMGVCLSEAHAVFFGWSQQGLPGVEEAKEIILEGMPRLVVGARVNTSIGDQFAYRWGTNPDEGLFGFASGFGAGLFLFGAATDLTAVKDMKGWQPYKPPSL